MRYKGLNCYACDCNDGSINYNACRQKVAGVLDENFDCESICFFSNYSTKSIHITENKDDHVDFTNSKILSKDDEFAFYDVSTNEDVNLPKSFILEKNDLSFYKYKKNKKNTSGSFVYNCNISIESVGYRIITFKLNDNGNEINFLLSTEKIFISQIIVWLSNK